MLRLLNQLLFPPKCILCQKILAPGLVDLCARCRAQTPEFTKSKKRHSFLARWTAVWYYKGNVRNSILRYKFQRRVAYAPAFGRFMAMKLQEAELDDFDILTWVPISAARLRVRGYDQMVLVTRAVGRELGVEPEKTLVKIRNTPPQSSLHGFARRKANVLGAYRVTDPQRIKDKRILLLDDVITTGATASECARTLLTAGAKEVTFAAIATADE